MIPLISKESSQIVIPITPKAASVLESSLEIIIESGVAVITFTGQNPTDWTRDALSFPVGQPIPQANFQGGIVSGSPTSFSTDPAALNINIVQDMYSTDLPVTVYGNDANNDTIVSTGNVGISVPGSVSASNVTVPGIGWAVDSATVAYSTEAGHPVATFALAVFGTASIFLRVAYTAYLMIGQQGTGGAGGVGGVVKHPL